MLLSTTYPDLNTTFPDSLQDFPQMLDITQSDGPLVAQYQQYMQQGNFNAANQVLNNIPFANQKALTSNDLNLIGDTTLALERVFLQRFYRFYVVSSTQPEYQETGDLWFEVLTS